MKIFMLNYANGVSYHSRELEYWPNLMPDLNDALDDLKSSSIYNCFHFKIKVILR